MEVPVRLWGRETHWWGPGASFHRSGSGDSGSRGFLPFVYSFIQQTLSECLLCARHGLRHWRHSSEQKGCKSGHCWSSQSSEQADEHTRKDTPTSWAKGSFCVLRKPVRGRRGGIQDVMLRLRPQGGPRLCQVSGERKLWRMEETTWTKGGRHVAQRWAWSCLSDRLQEGRGEGPRAQSWPQWGQPGNLQRGKGPPSLVQLRHSGKAHSLWHSLPAQEGQAYDHVFEKPWHLWKKCSKSIGLALAVPRMCTCVIVAVLLTILSIKLGLGSMLLILSFWVKTIRFLFIFSRECGIVSLGPSQDRAAKN